MHKYLRSIGFSTYTGVKQIQELVRDTVMNSTIRMYTTRAGSNGILAEFDRDIAPGIGLAVCGEFDEGDTFNYQYYYPYLRGSQVSSAEDVTIERHAATESYAGMCDDNKVEISLIFYLQNMIEYVRLREADMLPCAGTSLTLAALASQATVMLPIIKSEQQRQRIRQSSINRSQLIDAARRGDEEAIETLTLEDMDTYSAISRRILTEDVFSLVDTYFMPCGVECDQYSVLGEILACREYTNQLTDEALWWMTLECNDLTFDLCMNAKDLYGEPQVGRRLKASIWMQGKVNFPRNS